MFVSVRSRRRWLRLTLALIAVAAAILVIVVAVRAQGEAVQSLERRPDDARSGAAEACEPQPTLGLAVCRGETIPALGCARTCVGDAVHFGAGGGGHFDDAMGYR